MRKVSLLFIGSKDTPLKSISNSDMIYISFHNDNTGILEIDPLYKFIKFKNLVDLFAKKDNCLDTMFLKNYPYLKIYIRALLKELLDPLILVGVVNPTRVLVIDGLNRVYDDNEEDIINVGISLSKYIRHEFNLLLDIRILIKEEETFHHEL